jgi:hypothetical protein
MLRRMRNALVDNVCEGAAQNHSPYGQSDVIPITEPEFIIAPLLQVPPASRGEPQGARGFGSPCSQGEP